MQQWHVGGVRITKLVELESWARADAFFADATPELIRNTAWLSPHYADERGRIRFSVHAFIIETSDLRVIVDTCIGNDKTGRDLVPWNGLQTRFLGDLSSAGFAREDIDVVLCTHLHVDHVGWNTMLVEGRWVPTFPRARYLFERNELNYWQAQKEMREAVAVHEDSIAPVLEAGLVELIDAPYVVCPEITLRGTPGHTPGHISVEISSQGKKALITGDFIHHPCQFAHPTLVARPDRNPVQAVATRNALLERDAESDTLWLGTHFVTPTGGFVRRTAGAYRFEP